MTGKWNEEDRGCSSRPAQATVALHWQNVLDVHLRPTCPRTAANAPVITVAGAGLAPERATISLYIPVSVCTAINP